MTLYLRSQDKTQIHKGRQIKKNYNNNNIVVNCTGCYKLQHFLPTSFIIPIFNWLKCKLLQLLPLCLVLHKFVFERQEIWSIYLHCDSCMILDVGPLSITSCVDVEWDYHQVKTLSFFHCFHKAIIGKSNRNQWSVIRFRYDQLLVFVFSAHVCVFVCDNFQTWQMCSCQCLVQSMHTTNWKHAG